MKLLQERKERTNLDPQKDLYSSSIYWELVKVVSLNSREAQILTWKNTKIYGEYFLFSFYTLQ